MNKPFWLQKLKKYKKKKKLSFRCSNNFVETGIRHLQSRSLSPCHNTCLTLSVHDKT